MGADKDFVHVRAQLQRWREEGRPGRKVPEGIWKQAVKLARKHGVSKASTQIGVGYCGLRRRVEGDRRAVTASEESKGSFIEVSGVGGLFSSPECLIELENRAGERLRVALSGAGTAEAGAVITALRLAGGRCCS